MISYILTAILAIAPAQTVEAEPINPYVGLVAKSPLMWPNCPPDQSISQAKVDVIHNEYIAAVQYVYDISGLEWYDAYAIFIDQKEAGLHSAAKTWDVAKEALLQKVRRELVMARRNMAIALDSACESSKPSPASHVFVGQITHQGLNPYCGQSYGGLMPTVQCSTSQTTDYACVVELQEAFLSHIEDLYTQACNDWNQAYADYITCRSDAVIDAVACQAMCETNDLECILQCVEQLDEDEAECIQNLSNTKASIAAVLAAGISSARVNLLTDLLQCCKDN